MPPRKKPRVPLSSAGRKLNARPDTLDFRDLMYQPTLVEVPIERPLAQYREARVPVLDQGREGACTGYGLATVVHYLLRTRRPKADGIPVSPAMLYVTARRYDEWPGEDYEGSSARGAMKGWHKHGVCGFELWKPGGRGKLADVLTDERAADARTRPLGAYFRVNHKDLIAMHAAIAEVGILYATASVHSGWDRVNAKGEIPFVEDETGGHAFAIVGYDRVGFWIQNSWGEEWGRDGYARISYDDWFVNGTDAWVARLGVPVELAEVQGSATRSRMAARGSSYAWNDLRPHVVSLGNDGMLRSEGTYGTSAADVESIFRNDFPRITRGWQRPRLLLYAHGGLTSEDSALQRIADVRETMLENEIYPVAFVWKTDYWTTLTNALRDAARRRRPEGVLDATKDFLLDRLDDMLEPIARTLTGKLEWDEMKENALAATVARDGGARFVAGLVAPLARHGKVEVHVAGHSAGSILHAPLVRLLTATGRIADGKLEGATGFGTPIATCTLWAPACTIGLFKEYYLPAITADAIGRFGLFTLTDSAEQDDDCAGIYHKSLLYLVSHAFEAVPRIPLTSKHGEPLLGMERWILQDAELGALTRGEHPKVEWVKAPNQNPPGPDASTARHHGDFDDDRPTVMATLARILGRNEPAADLHFEAGAASRRDRRRELQAVL